MEAVTGTMHMTVLVARLVSGYSSTPVAKSENDR
jgi:hypothetical protein